MGVTFTANLPETADRSLLGLPCPDCDCKNRAYGGEEPPVDCPECFGYGGDTEAEDRYWAQVAGDGHLSLHSGNAAIVLEWLQEVEQGCYGSLDATTALLRLHSAFDIESSAKAPSESGGEPILTAEGVGMSCKIFNGGVTAERLRTIHTTLVNFCERAVEAGTSLSWS